MKKFRLQFVVNEAKLKTLVDLLVPEVEQLTINELGTELKTRRPRDLTQSPRVLKCSEKEKAVFQKILPLLKPNAHYHRDQFKKIVSDNGFSASSASSILSHMVSLNMLRRIRYGVYALPETPLQQ